MSKMDLGVEKDKATYYCWAEGLLTESNKLHFFKSQVTIRTAGHRDSFHIPHVHDEKHEQQLR